MLNLLQHYQKYNYKVPDSNRTKQSSCDVNSDKYPKYRICLYQIRSVVDHHHRIHNHSCLKEKVENSKRESLETN